MIEAIVTILIDRDSSPVIHVTYDDESLFIELANDAEFFELYNMLVPNDIGFLPKLDCPCGGQCGKEE